MILSLVFLLACSESSPSAVDTTPDTLDPGADGTAVGDNGETPADTETASDSLADLLTVHDVPSDTADVRDPSDTAISGPLELPLTPQEIPVHIDWALNGTPGLSGVLLQTGLATHNGDLFVTAYFSGTVSVGNLIISADDTSYTHVLGVRVSPKGEVRYLRHLCDGCSGAAGEASDGRIALVSMSKTLVGNPTGPDLIDLTADEAGMAVTIISPDGYVETMRRFAVGPDATVRCVRATQDGGWLVGGHFNELAFENGTTYTVPEPVFWPGQGFIVKLTPNLKVDWVELVKGTAASSVSMLAEWGAGFVAVGDFGGYPLGVVSEFGTSGVTLEALSSDDDPAMDIFITRWSAPGDVLFARRVQHYSNGPRNPTWLDVEGDTLTTRVDSVAKLEVDDELHYRGGYGESGVALSTRWDSVGTLVESVLLPYGANRVPMSPHYAVLSHSIPGDTITWGKEPNTLTFEIPKSTGQQSYETLISGLFHEDGAVGKAGVLGLSYRAGQVPPYIQAVSPQPDGTFLAVLYGSASIVFEPEAEPPTVLDNDGYERLIFAKIRLGELGL